MTRLELAHAEFERVAGETLALLREEREVCAKAHREFQEATREAIAACDELLEAMK